MPRWGKKKQRLHTFTGYVWEGHIFVMASFPPFLESQIILSAQIVIQTVISV
jgi:hypothetical protein